MISGPDNSRLYLQSEDSGLFELLKTRAERNPEAVAFTAPGRSPLSYGHLLRQVERTIDVLRAFGLTRNDRVAVVLPNGPEMAVAFLAVAAGATCAPLNPSYRANEFDFYLSDLNARALVVWSEMDSPAREVAQRSNIPVIELVPTVAAGAGMFDLAGKRKASAPGGGFARPDDVALVLHTSGTTSRPKIVPLTHTNILSSGRNIAVTLRLTENDRCLNVMPLFHIHGLIGAVVSSLAAGASVVCTRGLDASSFFGWVDIFQPTWYTAVPAMHQAILARAPAYREIIARRPLRFVRSCSAALPARVMVALEDAFAVPVIESYGMTEAAHQMTSNPLPPWPRKAGSVGFAAGPEVAIMDEAGNLLPFREVGEVVIRGNNVMNGYENNPASKEGAFMNGWFRTGDQGWFDDDGYLFLRDRLKEIINRGGEKIAPLELDEVLSKHQAVAQAVAFAVPHSTLGEDIAVAVVLKEGASVTETEIRDFASTRLVHFKVPGQVLIVEEIPKGPTGKVQRIGLVEKLAQKMQENFVAPRTVIEKELTEIWKEMLNVERIGVRDNFFMLGGDSLGSAMMMIEIENRFNTEILVDVFNRTPTIETIAGLLQDTEPVTLPVLHPDNGNMAKDVPALAVKKVRSARSLHTDRRRHSSRKGMADTEDNDVQVEKTTGEDSMKKYMIFGISTFLSDIFDLIHVNNGQVYKIFHNVKEIWHERVLPLEKRLDLLGYPCQVFDSLKKFEHEKGCEYVIGTTTVQKYELVHELKERYKIKISQLIHPKVVMGSNVQLGEGVVINGQVVMGPNVFLDDYCVVNRAVSIGHDVKVGKYTNIGPGVTLGGSSKIGDKCVIGIGATVLDRIHIGDWSVIGAGSLVTKDLQEGVVAMGIPAKVMRKNEEKDFSVYKEKKNLEFL